MALEKSPQRDRLLGLVLSTSISPSTSIRTAGWAISPPGHLPPAVFKLQRHFLLRPRQFCWDRTLFSHEKCPLEEDFSISLHNNTGAHISPESSLLYMGSSFLRTGMARPRLEILESIDCFGEQKWVTFYFYPFLFSFFTLFQTHNVSFSFCPFNANTTSEKWIMTSENPKVVHF